MREEFHQLLDAFHFVDPDWSGNALAPFWGCEIAFNLVPDEDGDFTARQLDTLRAILAHTDDLRPDVERQLFAFYQEDVFGCSEYLDDEGNDITNECAPPLDEPSAIWSLLELLNVRLAPHGLNETNVAFQMLFDCSWDPEHGLGVQIKDWQIDDIGGWTL